MECFKPALHALGACACYEEYDALVDYCARRGYPRLGRMAPWPLPAGVSVRAMKLIEADVDAFQARVRATCYAFARKDDAE